MWRHEVDYVIIGAGLTGLTTAFHLMSKGKKVLVLEREERIGGQIRTCREGDFVFESGPNTGAVSHPEVAELFGSLVPDCELEIANEDAKRRLIWKGNRFHELPAGLINGLTTPLFSFYDKFRILGEPFRAKGTNPDESVGQLARRRLGKSYLNYAVDPFVSGVYAGDPMQLTTRYALPKLYNLEQQYGSFIKGAVAKAREPKSDRDRLATKKVFSAVGGLENLVQALGKRIGKKNLILSTKEIEVYPCEGGWNIQYTSLSGTGTIRSGNVITTTQGYTLPNLLPFLTPDQLLPVKELAYAPIIQVSVGLKNAKGLLYNAFGGLIPSCENKQILGILFPSACFKERAPENGALFSFFLGGVRHPEYLQLPDEKIEEMVCTGLTDLLQYPASTSPDMIRIFRHSHAIPQYRKDSGERLQRIQELEKTYPGLTLAGNIRDGIGMADRIRQGMTLP